MAAHASQQGWYPDPEDPGRQRFWNGSAWTDDVAVPATGPRRTAADAARDVHDFLRWIRGAGYVDARTVRRMDDAVEDWAAYQERRNAWVLSKRPMSSASREQLPAGATAAPAAPAPPVHAPIVRPAPIERHLRAVPPRPLPAPTRPVERAEPQGPTWVERFRAAVASDVTVHGLAYAGVLMLLAGVVGFVVFAFRSLQSPLRPLAEVLLPASLFATGAFLAKRGASVGATALVVGGAALVPVAVIAPLVDGTQFPPDVTGTALAVVASLAVAIVAAVYSWIGTTRPNSPIRFLAAPVAWMSVGLAALIPAAGDVAGREIAAIRAYQVAAMALALAVTSLAARRWPQHPLARPTIRSCLVGGPVLLLLAAATAGQWQSVAVVVLAASIVLALEGLAEELPAALVGLGQPVAATVAVVALSDTAGPGWAGALGVVGLLALLEWEGRRRPEPIYLTATAAAVLSAGAFAFVGGPWFGLAVAATATSWAHVRRLTRPAWLSPGIADAAAALAPAAIAIALFDLLEPWTAATVIAVAVLAVVLVARWLAPADEFLRRWSVAVVAVAGVIPIVLAGQGHVGWLAVAAGVTTIAAAVLPVPIAARLWFAGALAVTTASLTATALDVTPRAQAVVLSMVALSMVLLGIRRSALMDHLGALGHVLAVCAGTAVVLVPEPSVRGMSVTIVLALMVGGWVATLLASVLRSSPVLDLVERVTHTADLEVVVAVAAAIGLPLVTASAYDSAFGLTETSWWAVVAIGATGWLVAASSHMLSPRPRVGVAVTVIGTVTAIVAAAVVLGEPWPAITASAIAAATALSTARPWRGVWTPWIVYLATVPVAHNLATVAGLPAEHLEMASVVWGTVLTVFAYTTNRVWATPVTDRRVSDPWLLPPALVGPLLTVVGVMAAVTSETPGVWGSAMLVAAVAAVAMAWGLRSGSGSIVAWLLATAGLAAVLPVDVPRHPWLLVVWAAGVCVVAMVIEERLRPADPWQRWDLAALAAATASTVTAVIVSVGDGDISLTWLLAGLLAFGVAAWRREWPWAVAGVILLNGVAVVQGWWWTAAALAATALAATLAAQRLHGRTRWLLQAIAVGSAGAAAAAAAEAAGWSAETRVVVAALAGGGAVVAVASLRRLGLIPNDWWVAGAALGGAGLLASAAWSGLGDRTVVGLALAAGLSMTALGSAMSARPVALPALRHAGVVLAGLAATVAWWAVEPDPVWVVAATSATAAGLTGFTVVWHRVRPTSPWLVPLVLAALASVVGAITAAAIDLPSTTALVVALVISGAVVLVLGTSLGNLALQLAGPPALGAAAIILASDSLAGHALWLAVPAGVAVLTMVELARASRGRLGGIGTPASLLAVECVGLLALALPPLVDMVVSSPWFVFAALATGATIGGWAVVTRVRRRLLAGALEIGVAVAVLIGLPLVELATSPDFGPTSGSAVFWLLIAGIGVAAIVIAVGIEQGRNRLRAARTRVLDLTQDWE